MMTKRSKWPVFLSLALALTLIFAVGCSEGATPEEEGEPTEEEEEVEEGGVLKLALNADITSLDPAEIQDAPTSTVAGQIYDTLVRRNFEGENVAALAKEWTANDDATVWTFELKEGVTFSDGSDFNADVVKWHFERLLDPDTGSRYRSQFGMIDEIEVVGEYTVKFHLDSPCAAFIDFVIITNGGYIPSKEAMEERGEDYGTNPSGTGPFVFDEWVPGQKVVLTVNEDYHGGSSKLDGIEYMPVPETSTALMKLEMGELHMVNKVPYQDLERLQEDENITVYMEPDYSVRTYTFNLRREPFDDKLVRQALAQVVDYRGIVKDMLGDLVTFGNTYIPSASWAYPDNPVVWEYDQEAALEKFAEAGWTQNEDGDLVNEDGEQMSFNIMSSNNRYLQDKQISEVVQERLRQLGIDVEVEVLEWGGFLDKYFAEDWDMVFIGWLQSSPEPSMFTDNLILSDGSSNICGYANEEVDALFEEAMATFEREDRKELYEEAAQIYDEDCPFIYLYETKFLRAVRKEVQGYTHSPASNWLGDVWLKSE